MVFLFWLGAFVGIFYLGFPIVGTAGVFLLALHSIAVIFRLKSNPQWYYLQCAAHSIEPNINAAIVTKAIVAIVSLAVGVWASNRSRDKGASLTPNRPVNADAVQAARRLHSAGYWERWASDYGAK